MGLRAKPPEAVTKRLKLMIYGTAGVGKTTAAVQFPRSYIIDGERGTENYDELIRGSDSVVFQTTDFQELVSEVKSLLTVKHEYRTLVIDPITTIFNDLVDKCEMQVGQEFGRHIQAANKHFKRLINLIYQLDMNVCLVCHAKAEYGQGMTKLGITFDGFKQIDYMLDLVIELGKKGKKRMGKVVKSRLKNFPDEDVFEWSYDAIKSRCDVGTIEKEAAQVKLAAPEQVREIKELLSLVRLPEGTVDKWFAKAGVDLWEDMAADVVGKCIEYVKSRLPHLAATGGRTGELRIEPVGA